MSRGLRLWAPRAKQIEIEIDGTKTPMTRDDHGVFTAPPPHGAYHLYVDGERVLDPTAGAAESVLGPGLPVDHGTFQWTDKGFPPPELGVIYELHIGTLTKAGTFDSAIETLPYLASLGVTHLELMPVATFSGARGWGYDGAALFAPHPSYGGPEGLKRFVDAAHAHGLAVVLDVVYNHLGPIGNWLDKLGPYFRDDRHTPWGRAVNLDGPGSDEVRRFFLDNALGWLQHFHLDGLRLDAVHALEDTSARPFMEELSDEVRALGRDLGKHLVLIAESDLNDPRIVRPVAQHGFGFDAQWSDDFHHALHVVLTGETTGYYSDFARAPQEMLADALTHGFVYRGQYSEHRQRRHGRPLGSIGLGHLLGYAQNHDQVGNRARGDRLSSLVTPAQRKLAMTLVLTAPFVPMLFMGEEWGAKTPFLFFTDHQDPEVAEATRQGRKREFRAFGWLPDDIPDPQDLRTFQQSKLRWDERNEPEHAELLLYTKRLLALRARTEDLRHGPSHARVEHDMLILERGRTTVVCNLGSKDRRITVAGKLLLVSADEVRLSGSVVFLPPHQSAVLSG